MGLEDRDWFQEGRRERIRRAEASTPKAAPRPDSTSTGNRGMPPSAGVPGGPARRRWTETQQIAGILAVALVFACAYWIDHESGPVRWIMQATGQAPDLPPRPFPPNGEVKWFVYRTSGPLAPVGLFGGSSPERVMALFQTWRSHQPVVEVFIHPYGNASIMLPIGRYRLVLVSGKVWHGAPEYFGGSGMIRAALPPIVLTDDDGRIMGRRIFLHRELYGNLPTETVDHP